MRGENTSLQGHCNGKEKAEEGCVVGANEANAEIQVDAEDDRAPPASETKSADEQLSAVL